ncbi:MAG: hypothetical protein WCJ29_05390 [bacterium]
MYMKISAFVFVAFCHLAGCAPREEDAAGKDQPKSESSTEKQAALRKPRLLRADINCLTIENKPKAVFGPISMLTPYIMVDAFHETPSTLGEFFVQNPASTGQTIGSLSVDMGALCPLFETVVLKNDRGLMSDVACQSSVEFTIDKTLAPDEVMTFEIEGLSKIGFDAALAAKKLERMSPFMGLRPTVLKTSEGPIQIGIHARGPMLIVRTLNSDEPEECYDFDAVSGTYPEKIGARLGDKYERALEIADNIAFKVPLEITYYEPSEEYARVTTDLVLEIQYSGDGVQIRTGSLIDASTNTWLREIEVASDKLVVTIKPEELSSAEDLFLLMQAPGSRGLIRFRIDEDSFVNREVDSLVDCYPTYSDGFLVLPAAEAEATLR